MYIQAATAKGVTRVESVRGGGTACGVRGVAVEARGGEVVSGNLRLRGGAGIPGNDFFFSNSFQGKC